MNIYTRKGDRGKTDLFSGERVKKYNIQVEAYGVVDELNSCLGISRSKITEEKISKLIQEIQQKLFVIGAELASRKNNLKQTIESADVSYLEEKIDFFKEKVKLKNNFSVPGDNENSSFLDLSRTVCRRAERRIFKLNDLKNYELNNYLLEYINRLSDLLFILSKLVGSYNSKEDKNEN
ncbi:MAG: cob(I)yrinic acid a,c-diamide adenosyltransferase [Halanaerobium sp.]